MEEHLEQRSESWKKWRQDKIGSSDAPVIMEVSPWKTPLELYNEKISLNYVEIESSYAMQRGVELEPQALALFESVTGYLMMPRVLVHPTHEWMAASLDGLELEGKCAVEIKCPGHVDHNIAIQGKIPEKYIPQLQHILEVTGLESMFYMSYRNENDYKILEVKKDYEYTKLLIEKELEFWDRVQRRDPPPSTDRDIKEIKDPEWASYVDKWRMLQDEKRKLEERENEIRENFIQLANNHPAQGFGLKLSKTVRKGCVDFTKIPELKGVDLELYRKPPFESWRITMQKEN